MLTIELDMELADRLIRAARQLGKSHKDCAVAAIRTWVEDCEQAARMREQLGPGGTVNIPEGFWD
jgi:predicted transcriptional regulator